MLKLRIIPAAALETPPNGQLLPPDDLAPSKVTPWDRTAVYWLRRIAHEGTRPEMMLGMGLGAGFFQVGRALGLRSLLGLGIRGTEAVLLGRAAGVVAETSGFLAASHGVAHVLGQPLPQDWKQLGREWLSMAVFLGAARSAQGLVNWAYGPSWTPKSTWQSLHHGLAQQGATYGVMAATAAAEWNLGWRDYKNHAQWLGDTLANLGTFQLAGIFAHQAVGKHLLPMVERMEAGARAGEQRAKDQGIFLPGRQFATPLGAIEASDSPIREGLFYTKEDPASLPRPRNGSADSMEENTSTLRIHQAIGPGEIVRKMDEHFVEDLLGKNILFQVQGSFDIKKLDSVVNGINKAIGEHLPEGTQRISPDRKVTLLFVQPELNPHLPGGIEISLGKDGFYVSTNLNRQPPVTAGKPGNGDEDAMMAADTRRAPKPSRKIPMPRNRPSQDASLLEIGPEGINSWLEFVRKVRTDIDAFLEKTADNPGKFATDVNEADQTLNFKMKLGFREDFALKLLNDLPNIETIIGSRTVTFNFGPKEPPFVAVKVGSVFVDAKKVSAGRATPPFIPTREIQKASDEPISSGNLNVEWDFKHIPEIVRELSSLPILLRKAAQSSYPGPFPSLIWEGNTISLPSLQDATKTWNPDLSPGTSWELLAPANANGHRSYVAVIREGKVLEWKVGSTEAWEQAEAQVPFSKRIVQDAVSIYQQLVAVSRARDGAAPKAVAFQHRGKLTQEYIRGLSAFIEQTLNRYSINGERFEVLGQERRLLMHFEPRRGRWKSSLRTTGSGPQSTKS